MLPCWSQARLPDGGYSLTQPPAREGFLQRRRLQQRRPPPSPPGYWPRVFRKDSRVLILIPDSPACSWTPYTYGSGAAGDAAIANFWLGERTVRVHP